jgi:protease YdgD
VKAAALLAALAAAWATAAPAESLRPLTLRQDLLGWEGVGRIELGNGYCTGVLVAPDLVLTAAHCLYDGDAIRPREGIRFRAGQGNGESIAERQVAQAAMIPGYHPGVTDAAWRIAADVALLRLDAPIPAGTARPFLVAPPPSGGAVSVVSYGAGRDSVLSRQDRCNVLARQDGVIAFDCDVTFGSSGAPVFRTDGATTRIVSIVSAGHKERGEDLAFGPTLQGQVDTLSAALRAGRGIWETGLPEARRIGIGADREAGGARFLKP